MSRLLKLGRLFYGFGIAALGIHQLIIRDFRPDILPPFPAWAHQYVVFPVVAGMALIFAGVIITGLVQLKGISIKSISLYLASAFAVLIVFCHLPYIFFMSPHKLTRLDVWFGAGAAMAYCGGALLFANRYTRAGSILYCLLIIMFGASHFVFTDFVSTMVPAWLGARIFWTYFVGVLLIAAGIAIILRIWVKTVALLLAIMLFLFFLLFHVPDAIANPTAGGGNEIVRATVCLLYMGIALELCRKESNS